MPKGRRKNKPGGGENAAQNSGSKQFEVPSETGDSSKGEFTNQGNMEISSSIDQQQANFDTSNLQTCVDNDNKCRETGFNMKVSRNKSRSFYNRSRFTSNDTSCDTFNKSSCESSEKGFGEKVDRENSNDIKFESRYKGNAPWKNKPVRSAKSYQERRSYTPSSSETGSNTFNPEDANPSIDSVSREDLKKNVSNAGARKGDGSKRWDNNYKANTQKESRFNESSSSAKSHQNRRNYYPSTSENSSNTLDANDATEDATNQQQSNVWDSNFRTGSQGGPRKREKYQYGERTYKTRSNTNRTESTKKDFRENIDTAEVGTNWQQSSRWEGNFKAHAQKGGRRSELARPNTKASDSNAFTRALTEKGSGENDTTEVATNWQQGNMWDSSFSDTQKREQMSEWEIVAQSASEAGSVAFNAGNGKPSLDFTAAPVSSEESFGKNVDTTAVTSDWQHSNMWDNKSDTQKPSQSYGFQRSGRSYTSETDYDPKPTTVSESTEDWFGENGTVEVAKKWKNQHRRDTNNKTGTQRESHFFTPRRSEPIRNMKEGQERGRRSCNATMSRANGRDTKYTEKRQHGETEFDLYEREIKDNPGVDSTKIFEIEKNLFDVDEEYSLAHCVAEDMNMGSGIAVQFRRDFKRVDELLNQRQRTGGLAVLTQKQRFIYYLVTKRVSAGKPTYETLFSSLQKLREHVVQNGVKKLAMPRIGCGLDRLTWANVKYMIEFVFKNVDVDVLICSLQLNEESPSFKHKNCRVTNVTHPIEEIEIDTIIIYLTSEDGFVSNEMEALDKKFNFLPKFRASQKACGNVIFFDENKEYLLCGCIVHKTKDEQIDFVSFQKCIRSVQKEIKKYDFYYVGFQAMKNEDPCINPKLINLLRNVLREVEIYVCWSGDLQNEMAQNGRWSDYSLQPNKNDTSLDWRSDNISNSENWDNSIEDVKDVKAGSESKDESKSDQWFDNSKEQVLKIDHSQKLLSSEEVSEDHDLDAEFSTYKKSLNSSSKLLPISELSLSNPTKNCPHVYFTREDMKLDNGEMMGHNFKRFIGDLLNQKQGVGGVASAKCGNMHLYCLVTSTAQAEATPKRLFQSVKNLVDFVKKHNIKKLLIHNNNSSVEWSDIKEIFQYLFCSLKVDLFYTTREKSSTDDNNIKVLHKKGGIQQMNKKSVILYLASEDGKFSLEMNALKSKFEFEGDFLKKPKRVGDIITYKENEDYVLYGCIVKKKFKDEIDLSLLQTCLHKVNEYNSKKEKLSCVGIQAVEDADCSINSKIMSVLMHSIDNVTIKMCWPANLKEKIPKGL